MPKMHGRGFGDIEMLNRFKEPTFYDNVDKLRPLHSSFPKN